VKQAICSGAEKKQLNTQLMDAVRSGRIRDVRRLLDAGANANVRDNYSAGQENKTALMFAAEKGYTAICRVLINHGAYVNATDIERMTALMEAALGGHTGTCALLLKKGAKPKARDNSNMTALMWAEQNYKDTAEILRREASDETRR
jgi:ankyrin repeat protein